MTEKIKVSDQEIQWFKKELSIYAGIVLVPINLVCIAVMFMKGIPFFIPLLLAVLIDAYFYNQIKRTFDDINAQAFVKKKGLLKRKLWGFNLNKFEYCMNDEPETFSSYISRFNSFENHEVVVVYTKNTHKILKMNKI